MTSESTPVNGTRPPSRESVASVLRQRIRGGDFGPGTRLPTQQDLEQEFGVNRTVVRQALGILKAEGLVTMGRGAPATVSGELPEADHRTVETPRAADVELTERLHNAFRAEHVTIDAFSFTTETLNSALTPTLNAISAGELAPRSVTVRVLVPSFDANLALPRLVADPHDGRPLERIHKLMAICANTLRVSLETLRIRKLVPEVSLELRIVPVTPMHKLYVLNGTEALIGYYKVVQQEVPLGGELNDIYDVMGLDMTLFRSSSGPGYHDEQEARFVEESTRWFESLWSTIARPVTLD